MVDGCGYHTKHQILHSGAEDFTMHLVFERLRARARYHPHIPGQARPLPRGDTTSTPSRLSVNYTRHTISRQEDLVMETFSASTCPTVAQVRGGQLSLHLSTSPPSILAQRNVWRGVDSMVTCST